MSNWKNPTPDASPVRSPTDSVTMQIPVAQGEAEPADTVAEWQVLGPDGHWLNEDADIIERRRQQGYQVRALYTRAIGEAGDTDELVERLKAERDEAVHREFSNGWKLAKDWAKERFRAEAAESSLAAEKQRVVELTADRDERLDEASKWADGWQQACSTAEVLLGIGPCLAADEFPAAIQAYVAAAETQMRAKDEALGHVHNWLVNTPWDRKFLDDARAIDAVVLDAINFKATTFAPVTTPPAETTGSSK